MNEKKKKQIQYYITELYSSESVNPDVSPGFLPEVSLVAPKQYFPGVPLEVNPLVSSTISRRADFFTFA